MQRAQWGVAILLSGAVLSWGQVADGNLSTVVIDSSGAAIQGAAITVENTGTGQRAAAATDGVGRYQFNNLPVGQYKVTASASGFQTVTLTGINVELSRTASAYVTLSIGAQTESVTVTDTGSLIDATTAQIANLYSTRLAQDLALSANGNRGYLNLSLLGAGVASAGGIGVGTGPSVGGQRPRNNNFTVDGIDNNRKDITGPIVQLPTDAVQEFTVLQNQFNAEFGHSSGGQFNAVARSGSNQTHGRVYEYFMNRYLNAQDQMFKRQGTWERTRYDSNLIGGTLGGALKRDKLFYFGNFDYNPEGKNSTSTTPIWAPTAAGYTTLGSIPALSQSNLSALKQYLPAATQWDGASTVNVQGQTIPVGIVPVLAPVYTNIYRGLISLDYNPSTKDQLRGRIVQNRQSTLDTGAQSPEFWTPRPTRGYVATISELHSFSSTLANEVRVAYNRFNDKRPVGNAVFPGMNVFPTVGIMELGLLLGPFSDAPQATTQNTYQVANNVSWNVGRHDLRFGFDGRDAISSMDFILSVRGDYRYSSLERYLRDITPDVRALRNVGVRPYRGNSMSYYLYANDNWRVSRRLTVNLGLRWEYNGVSKSMKEQALNSVADVPGLIAFRAPRAQMTNFAPRIGFAYSPGNRGTTSIRGGFGLAYDQIFDNIGNNVRPPQVSTSVNVPNTNTAGFLALGGIPSQPVGATLSAADARRATTGWLPDQKLGYAVNWNFGIQQSFRKDYVVDVRYVGTRGVHLLAQTMLNRVAQVTPGRSLPVYLTAPSQAELDALPLTLNQLQATSFNPWASFGFTHNSGVTAYVPQGNSIYHGLAIDVTKRFAGQFMFKGGYTWSHLMDDSTAEINSTTLSPRRPQDFYNMRSEWASSALDRRHRLTAAWLWDTPWFRRSQNWALRTFASGFTFSGSYTVESPQWVTPQSVIDANLNGDRETDRVIVNPNGIKGTGSDTRALTNSAGQIVGYAALDPTAQFLVAKQGVLPNSGRNVLPTRPINNFDLSAGKSFTVRERFRTEIRADFYNAFNHAQYVPGRINNVSSMSQRDTAYLNPANRLFGRWDQVFASNSRVVQLVAKFSF